METSQPKRAANRKEKSASFPEDAAYRLVQLFIRDEEKYNERRTGKSNKGKQARQICLEKWQEELAAMGCHRTTEQIYARIRGDLIHIRSVLTEEKAERGKTGGGKAKKSKKLDTARSMLYEHMEGSHTVLGISGGLESGAEIMEEEKSKEIEEQDNFDASYSCSTDILSLESIKEPESSSSGNKDVPKKASFTDMVKAKKRTPTTSLNEISEWRTKLLRAEYDVSQKKARNLDKEHELMMQKEAILKVKLETAELEKKAVLAKLAVSQ